MALDPDKQGRPAGVRVGCDQYVARLATATQIGMVVIQLFNADRLRAGLRRLGLSIAGD